jgi:hypothetical protein
MSGDTFLLLQQARVHEDLGDSEQVGCCACLLLFDLRRGFDFVSSGQRNTQARSAARQQQHRSHRKPGCSSGVGARWCVIAWMFGCIVVVTVMVLMHMWLRLNVLLVF